MRNTKIAKTPPPLGRRGRPDLLRLRALVLVVGHDDPPDEVGREAEADIPEQVAPRPEVACGARGGEYCKHQPGERRGLKRSDECDISFIGDVGADEDAAEHEGEDNDDENRHWKTFSTRGRRKGVAEP